MTLKGGGGVSKNVTWHFLLIISLVKVDKTCHMGGGEGGRILFEWPLIVLLSANLKSLGNTGLWHVWTKVQKFREGSLLFKSKHCYYLYLFLSTSQEEQKRKTSRISFSKKTSTIFPRTKIQTVFCWRLIFVGSKQKILFSFVMTKNKKQILSVR